MGRSAASGVEPDRYTAGMQAVRMLRDLVAEDAAKGRRIIVARTGRKVFGEIVARDPMQVVLMYDPLKRPLTAGVDFEPIDYVIEDD
jgi:hypothetical protein